MTAEELIRRALVDTINSNPKSREDLESKWGKVYDTKELQEQYIVHGFAAPFVVVEDKASGKKGTMLFQHFPRFYFEFHAV